MCGIILKKKKIKGLDKAICSYCQKSLSGNNKHGTTHLRDHFKTCSRRTVSDIRQKLLIKENKTDFAIKGFQFDQETSKSILAEIIILHEYPLTIVEHHGFQKLLASVQPLFKVPSRNIIKRDILKMYDFEKAKVLSLLESNKGRIALSTDMWTASNQRKFAYVRPPHTSEVLANVIVKSMMDWNIDRNISTITVDNCSTNDSLMNYVMHKLDHSTLMLGESLFHMCCVAHILNLVVQDGLNIIAPSVEKIRESVTYWRASPKREQKFDDVARIVMRNMNAKKLVLDCKTRWNSTYLMIMTVISFKEMFARLRFCDPSYKSFPTDEEWLLAEEVSQILKVFYSVTEIFSGRKYPTTNIFFPKVCEIKASLIKWTTSPNKIVSSVAERMLSKFEKYWSDIHGVMGIATILDPRYKTKLVEYCFKRTHGEIGFKEPVRRIQKMCYDLLDDYTNNSGHSRVEKRSMETRLNTSTDDFLDSFDKEVALECDIYTDFKTELDHYLEDKVLPRNVDFDILEWWKTNGIKYPTLMRMTRDLLVIPISTIASESAFSTGGRLVSLHRSRLHPKNLEALMCTQSWLLNEKQAKSSQEAEAYYS
ncbi:zinc finger BED domain-containing protein RICESLEEPER 2-like [Henckelia pumila]|uniref:zinc finger BED domain-containing protein RICESLEEPER 2-like n=1 Tax=Henckelia pumila TaxID=405737 RepID=UPI003C6E38EF